MATAEIIFNKEYNVIRITDKDYSTTRISKFLPFRISFQNVNIEAYGPSSPAPIGIAVIGFNNYIL